MILGHRGEGIRRLEPLAAVAPRLAVRADRGGATPPPSACPVATPGPVRAQGSSGSLGATCSDVMLGIMHTSKSDTRSSAANGR